MGMIQLVQDLVVYMEYGRFVQAIQFFWFLSMCVCLLLYVILQLVTNQTIANQRAQTNQTIANQRAQTNQNMAKLFLYTTQVSICNNWSQPVITYSLLQGLGKSCTRELQSWLNIAC